MAAALHFGSHHAGDEGFAHAALAADNGDDLFNACCGIEFCGQILLLSLGAAFAAGRAIMCTLTHWLYLLKKIFL